MMILVQTFVWKTCVLETKKEGNKIFAARNVKKCQKSLF